MRKMRLFFAAMALLVSALAYGQNITVTGTVTDSSNGEPIPFASIQLKGTMTGASADVNGAYSISVPSDGVMVFSSIGYVTIEEQVAGKAVHNVALSPDTQALEETIVVAFGTATKSAFTGSAAVVNDETLAKKQVASVTNALAGAVAGVQLTSSNGAPGSSSTIRIRGFSSLNAGMNPLIIVDGAPYSGDIANINQADVESMTVLKDAASNALYGARGANGVIIITTKKAKSGDAIVTFDAKVGVNTKALQQYNIITDPAMYYEKHYQALTNYYTNSQGKTADEAWALANKYITGDQGNGGLGYQIYTLPEGAALIGKNGKLNPNARLGNYVNYKGEDYLVTPDDWSNIGYRAGKRQEYNLSIAGSNEKSSFYASIGYLNNEGITENSDLERFTARLRADYRAKKWLKVGGNMNYTRFNGNSLGNNGSSGSSGNIWAFTSQMAPIYPAYIRNTDGTIKVDGNGIKVMDYGNGKNAGFSRPFISDANPIQDNKLNTRNSEGNALTANGFADFTFAPGLVLTINGTMNLDETRGTTVLNPYYGQFDTTGGTVEKSHGRSFDYNFQQLLNYSKTFADVHHMNILLGHEYYNSRYYVLGASKSKMFSQENKELSGAVVDGQGAYSYMTEYNNEGYFLRAEYDYDNRIFGSGSIRRDASSRFDPNYRWGTFWSVGAAWILSRENWFNASWVDELKAKASIGSQGNDNIGNYRYTDLFDITNSSGSIGTSFASKGTRDITWETNTNFNVGAEFGFFHRLTGSLEYFKRYTSDMLFSFSVAPSLGYSSYYDNVGDLYNEGLELELNYNIINKKNLQWDVNLNATTLKNRITKLHDDKKISSRYDASGKEYKGYDSGSFFVTEGVSMYTWNLKEYAGVNAETGESMWYKNIKDEAGNVTGRETTTTYADADYYVTGKTSIPDLYGGFGTNLQVYGFDFSVNFSYQLGGYQYDGTYASFMASPTGSNTGYNFHVDTFDCWTPSNTSSNIPRWQFGDTYSASSSTRFLTKSSYLNIEAINLGYTFPTKWTSKALINSLRIYVAANNVWYWSARRGFDPRQSFSSTTNATNYSPMRTVSGGVTFKF